MDSTTCKCKKKNTNELKTSPPETVDYAACCHIRGRRYMRMPYDDHWIQSAQFLSVVTVFVSLTWWGTFLLSLLGCALLQTLWCCRQTRSGMLAMAGLSVVCCLASLGVGIYVLVEWLDHDRCQFFLGTTYSFDDDDPYEHDAWKHADRCREALWAALFFIVGLLWACVVGCILKFVYSGRHRDLEHQNESNCAANTKKTTSQHRRTTAFTATETAATNNVPSELELGQRLSVSVLTAAALPPETPPLSAEIESGNHDHVDDSYRY